MRLTARGGGGGRGDTTLSDHVCPCKLQPDRRLVKGNGLGPEAGRRMIFTSWRVPAGQIDIPRRRTVHVGSNRRPT